MALAMPGSRAQDIYTGPLRLVEEGSTMLRALREQALAQKAANHVGLTPPDPEVEFGYFWPNPVTGGWPGSKTAPANWII